jgi:predicted HTH transcriptional regulator
MSVTDTEMYTPHLAEAKADTANRTYSVKPLEIAKKDKIGIAINVRNADEKRQSSRRVEILRTLSATPVSIKDISMHVLGCSEKTIQRELNNLVDDGSVERVGEKRWSKYVLRR